MFTSLSQKSILYSTTKFFILDRWAIISNLIRFDWGFWQSSKPFYRKLKYRGKVLEEFQRLPRFPRKMDLYSSTSFRILKPWAIISKLIRFNLDFWQTSKPTYRRLRYREKFWKSFNVHLVFPEKWFCIRQPNLTFQSLESLFRIS